MSAINLNVQIAQFVEFPSQLNLAVSRKVVRVYHTFGITEFDLSNDFEGTVHSVK